MCVTRTRHAGPLDCIAEERVKILLVHEYYQVRGGEDSMFVVERDLLIRGGHEVVCHEVHNDGIGRSLAARVGTTLAASWSPRASYARPRWL